MASAAVYALLGHLESPEMASFMKNDNLSTILENLRFLIAFHEDLPKEFVTKGKLADFKSVRSEAASIIYSFDVKEMDNDMAQEMNRWLLVLAEKIEQVKKEGKKVYDQIQNPPRSNFPKTEHVDFIDYVVENLRELLKHKAPSVALLNHQIATVANLLPSLKDHCVMDIEELDDDEELSPTEIEELHKRNEEFKELRTRIMRVVYEIEYVTDCSLCRVGSTWYHKFWLNDILEEIRLIMKAKVKIYDKESIVEHLISETDQGLDVVSILNVPAATKTSPAEEIYNDHYVIYHFDFRGRCVISQSYEKDKRKVLLDIRSSLMKGEEEYKLRGEVSEMSDRELAEELYKSLSGLKCLIVVEDMRDIQDLDVLRAILRKSSRASKILLITRFAEVAFQVSFTYVVKMDSELLANRFQLLMPQYLNVAKRSSHDSSQTSNPMQDETVVGLKDESSMMLDLLFSGPKHLQVVSIVGMGGIGKTTLAKRVYNDNIVGGRFDLKAWCLVSQKYERRNLLLQILNSVNEVSIDYRERSVEELAEMLYKCLKGWKYLIVLDDMWNIEAWNVIKRSFPDDRDGSRIFLTTRLHSVAQELNSLTHIMRPMSGDECWELLCSKIFRRESCPPELLTIGESIARNCKGIPLLIVLTAGFLAMTKKKEDRWKQVAEILNSPSLGSIGSLSMSVMELCYKYLPDHLKLCFLYFGGFPEDKIIPARRLMRLWIAERIVQHSDSKSLEEVAEDYLMDLIKRNLVTITEVNWKGGVKSCRVHDLIRDFCLVKAKDAKFWQHIDGNDEHIPVSDDHLDHGVDPKIYDRRWLSIYSEGENFFMSKPSGPRVRSLLFFASSDNQGRYSYDFSFMSENFKLLRVVDFEDINIGNSFEAVGRLVLLRFLAVQCATNSVPSSIANLLNLETFLFKGLIGEVTVPDFIFDMARLRHLQIRNHACFSLHNHRFENSSLLENLQTLSTPSLSYGDDMEKILRRLPRLQKLGCIFLDSWDDSRNRFPSLDFLSQLESLKVFYRGAGKCPCEFYFPSNLKKLTLSNFRMPWNELSKLAMLLPNLEVLKLQNSAFVGKRWEVGDECFPKLRILKLDRLDIEDWDAYEDSFPCLERLVVHRCKQLKEIPWRLGDILTLQMIEVKWCSHSAAVSARKIYEEQLDFGNEELRVDMNGIF